jgi:hypothetical protein
MSDPPRRRFMRPWKVIEHDESYEVQDAVGLPLAFVYFENEAIESTNVIAAPRASNGMLARRMSIIASPHCTTRTRRSTSRIRPVKLLVRTM